MPAVFFITHPDVRIDPKVPVPEWPLDAAAGSAGALEVLEMAKIVEFTQAAARVVGRHARARRDLPGADPQPSLLLMDEPFSALDAITRDEMLSGGLRR